MQDEVVIKKDRSLLLFLVVVLTLTFFVCITQVFNDYARNGTDGILYGVFIIVLFLTLLIYFGKELYERKVEMAISHEGIYLRKKGLYSWHLIKSFSTVEYYDSDVEKLVLLLENYADEYFEIADLEKKKAEIIRLILAYKGSSNVYYAGHKKK